LVTLSFGLNWAWSGDDPWSYRLVNVAIHAVGAALVWSCARSALRVAVGVPRDHAAPLAIAIASLWAAHPLQTSAVTYVVHRYESLASVLMLGMLAAWQHAVAARRPAPWFGLAILHAALAILSKEIAIVAPLLLIAYDHAFGDASVASRRARRVALVAVCVSAWGVAAIVYPRSASAPSQGVHAALGPIDYLRSEFGVLLYYLRLTALPYPLSVDYADWPITRAWLPALPAALAVAALGALTAWAFLVRAPRLGWLGVVFFMVLAPTSSVVPLLNEFVAERRMYLPLAAVLSLAVLGLHRLSRGRLAPVLAACAFATVACGAVTVDRNRDYRSEIELFTHDLRAHPNSSRLHCLLGEALSREQRQPLRAWREFERVLALGPGACKAHGHMAVLAVDLGWTLQAEHHMLAGAREDATRPWACLNAMTFFLDEGRDTRALHVGEACAAHFARSTAVAEKFAWVLATARDPSVVDGPRALREVERAQRLRATPQPSFTLQVTLAASLAAAGRTPEAHALALRLATHARAAGRTSLAAVLDDQARGYGAGERWIQSGRWRPRRAVAPEPPVVRAEPTR
jgi:hypothetical protein